MTRHKFTVGQVVEFLPGRMDFNVPRGTYTIVRQLPMEANDCQYRVKNAHDGHERIMRESQLAATSSEWDRARSEKLSR
ncbi:MAG: hypothetical protein JO209_02890 [Acidisphaera sp.]|nr:hypothetical protein [Acidisphaera sp.]